MRTPPPSTPVHQTTGRVVYGFLLFVSILTQTSCIAVCLFVCLFVRSRVRALGTAAVDMCQVATGGADAYYHIGMHCWDIAASAIIVQEAGGVVTDTDGGCPTWDVTRSCSPWRSVTSVRVCPQAQGST